MRPVLAKDIRNLDQLVITASDPDSQAGALPPLLEPQQKTLLDAGGLRVGFRRVSPNEAGPYHFIAKARELSEDSKDDKHSYSCQNFEQNKNFLQKLHEMKDLERVVLFR